MRWLALAGAVLIGTLLAIIGSTPPAPEGADVPDTAFSAMRAFADVEAIAAAPRPTGTEENARVRAYLEGRLRTLGAAVQTQEGELSDRARGRLEGWSGRDESATRLVNVIGVIEGRSAERPALLLMAHHDSVWGSPGAPDDAAGVASILEIVRALQAGGPPERSVIVLLTDAEELGLQGARAFFAEHPLAGRVGAIINFEARGGGGRASMFETAPMNGEAMRLFARAVDRPSASSLGVFVYSVLPNDTDLSAAMPLGVPSYNFAFIGRAGLYHSPLATPDRLDKGALQDMGAQGLALSRALTGVPSLPEPAPDLVFFDAFGLALVSYPAWFGWVVLLGASALFTVAAWPERDAGALARGAGTTLLALILAAALLLGLNLLSGAGEGANYYDRLAAIPRLEAMALLACLGAGLAVVGAFVGGRVPGASFYAGTALPLLLLALALQVLAPPAAYVVAVPLLLAGMGALAARRLGAAGLVAAAACAALVTGLMLQNGHQLMLGVGPSLPSVAALPLALVLAAVLPILPPLRRGRVWAAAAVCLMVAGAVALQVRLDPVADSVAVYAETRR
jgi:hypothetical protein